MRAAFRSLVAVGTTFDGSALGSIVKHFSRAEAVNRADRSELDGLRPWVHSDRWVPLGVSALRSRLHAGDSRGPLGAAPR